MNSFLSLVVFACLTVPPALAAGGQTPQASLPAERPAVPLTVEEVVRLSRAGVAEDVIAAKIKKNGKAFDLNTDELLDLKKYGVTDTLVRLMLDPTLPYIP